MKMQHIVVSLCRIIISDESNQQYDVSLITTMRCKQRTVFIQYTHDMMNKLMV